MARSEVTVSVPTWGRVIAPVALTVLAGLEAVESGIAGDWLKVVWMVTAMVGWGWLTVRLWNLHAVVTWSRGGTNERDKPGAEDA